MLGLGTMKVAKRFLAIIIFCVLGKTGFALQRHAVLIGINHYFHPGAPIPGAWRHDPLMDLDDGENNVASLLQVLVDVYGWDTKTDDIQILLSSQQVADRSTWPTQDVVPREANETNIRQALAGLSKAGEGDTVLFYYSGHGSIVRNNGTTRHMFTSPVSGESYGISNTIVPINTLSVDADITDKEIAKAFDAVLDKKAHLTAIFDSCYSGEISRGVFSKVVVKAAPEPETDKEVTENDLPDKDLPANRGAIVLSGCQFEEHAGEVMIENKPVGALTWALTKVLTSAASDPDVQTILNDTSAEVKLWDVAQNPMLDTAPECRTLDLFGKAAGGRSQLRVPISAPYNGSFVTLGVGQAFGLHKGAVLTGTVSGRTATLEIANEPSLSTSYAVFKGGDSTILKLLKTARVTAWAEGDVPSLRFYVPRTKENLHELEALAASMASLGPIQDPASETPFSEFLYDGQSWNEIKATGPNLMTVGALNAGAVKAAGPFFVSYPLPIELSSHVNFEPGDDATSVATIANGFDYLLAGRYSSNGLQYAWIMPNVGVRKPRPSNQGEALSSGNALAKSVVSMPVETAWIDASDPSAAQKLRDQANGLARVRRWLNLTSHDMPGAFPFHLEVTERATGHKLAPGDPIVAKLVYDFGLIPDSPDIPATVKPRHIYIFEIGADYSIHLWFPKYSIDDAPVIPSSSPIPGFVAGSDAGTKTFFLLTSVDPIPLDVFSSASLKSPDDNASGLEKLLRRAYSGLRGSVPPVPATWSISRVTLVTQPREQKPRK